MVCPLSTKLMTMCRSSLLIKSKELILLRQRIKYLESENKFLEDDIFNKQKRIDKLLENNNKLIDNQSHHVPIQYIEGSQSDPVNGSRSLHDSRYKAVDNNSLPAKLRENRNSRNEENHGVIKSTSKREIMIIGDSMIKHVNGREVFRDDSAKIRWHPGCHHR